MSRFVVFVLVTASLLAIAASGRAADAGSEVNSDTILFGEGFEDADLASRGWYDGRKFRVVGDAAAGTFEGDDTLFKSPEEFGVGHVALSVS